MLLNHPKTIPHPVHKKLSSRKLVNGAQKLGITALLEGR